MNKKAKSRTPGHPPKNRKGPKGKAGQRSHGGQSRARQKPKPRIGANIWGVHAVTEAWLNPRRDIMNFYATEQALKSFQDTLNQAQTDGIKRPVPEIYSRNDLDRALSGAVHQGLALEAAPLPEIFIQDIVNATRNNDKVTLVILDQVTDPHNVGAILRSASAFGADALVMQSRHAPEITGVLAKTACGAAEHIPVCYEINLGRTIDYLQESGFYVIGLDERGQEDIRSFPPRPRTALVLGAEGKGLRPSLADACDSLVRLPTQGRIQSLNVSNAAAVSLYAITAR